MKKSCLHILSFSLLLPPVPIHGTPALEIPIHIEELLPVGTTGVARTAAPLRFGVPLPESAAVGAATPVSIAGLPALQVRPLATYPSGAWRWMLVETLVDLQAGESRTATLSVGSGSLATGTPLASETTAAIHVNTGAAIFRIRKQNWNGIDAATVNNVDWIVAGHAYGLVAADSGRVEYRSALDAGSSVAIESNGPGLATVVARGWLRNTGGAALFAYTARLRFASGRSDVEMEITVQNAEIARLKPVHMRWVRFELPIAGSGESPLPVTFGLNGATQTTTLATAAIPLSLYQGRTTFREDSKTSYVRARMTDDVGVSAERLDTLVAPGDLASYLDGWIGLGGAGSYTGNVDVCLAVKDLAQLYPSGLQVGAADTDGTRLLSYDIISPLNTRTEPLLWAWGAHHTGNAVLGFGTSPQQAWAQIQFPVFARPSFEWMRQTGSLYGETRLVDLDTEVAWFAAMGKNYTTSPPTFSNLKVRRYYDFGSTGGPNQYDENLTYVIDYLRAGQRARLLQAMQDAAWKADQAVVHSDDFDYGTRAYGESDLSVSDPDGWNGRGRNTAFENEHPHWLTLPIVYYMTGNERLRDAVVDYCEWRRYRAGNRSYGPIYGKGLGSLRLWTRAWRDISLAWEFTGLQRYYDDMVRMTEAVVNSREEPGVRGRSLTRGYLYYGDWSNATRPIRLFFLNEIHGMDSREAYRLLPQGPLREDFRDYLTGLAYFTLETRLGADQTGFPYTYHLDASTTPGTRGDQVGMLLSHGYEWTGDPIFNETSRSLAWRTLVDEDWERGSELSTLVRCYTDLNSGARGFGYVRDLQVTGGAGNYTLTWTAPAGASQYIVKYATQPMVPHVWYDAVARTYRHDPNQYANFWAANNVQGEPAPAVAGTSQSMTVTGLNSERTYHFAVGYVASAPVAPILSPVTNPTSSYDEYGRIVVGWNLPAGAHGARVVRNTAGYAGFAYEPAAGNHVPGGTTSAVDSALGTALVLQPGSKHYYTVFALDAQGQASPGAYLAVTYAPSPLPPIVTATADPVLAEAPATVTFLGTASDPNGDLASVRWDFGDDSPGESSLQATHVYTSAGNYTARFEARDATGASRTADAALEVLPPTPPEITVTSSARSGRAPLTVEFEATATDASALADTAWVFASGDTVSGLRVSHTFPAGGRFTVHFFARDVFGRASRDSIELELLPPDVTPPHIVAAVPAPDSTHVGRDTDIQVVLAETETGLDLSSVRLGINGENVAAVTTGDTERLTLHFAPATPFDHGAVVQVRLHAADRAATSNSVDSTWTFQIDPDAASPRIIAASPTPGAMGVARNTAIVATIADMESGLDLSKLQMWMGGAAVSPVTSGDAGTATLRFQPNSPFGYGQSVTVRVRGLDRATSPNVVDSTWTFTTEVDATAPAIASMLPQEGATGVAPTTAIVVQVEDAASGVDASSLQFWINGQIVTPSFTGSPGSMQVLYKPAKPLAEASTALVRLRVRDRAAIPNVLDRTWSFTVGMTPKLFNFQPSTYPTPAGYVADAGRAYSTALGFGWLPKVSVESRSGVDALLSSYAYVKNSTTATWQLALPTGKFSVTLAVGSPGFTGHHRVEIEGVRVVQDVYTTSNQFYRVTDHVAEVSDGFLSVRIGGIPSNSKKTKLCYIEVRSLAGTGASSGGETRAGNQPPTVVASAAPKTGTAPLTVQFDATAADADEEIPTVSWIFGDSESADAGAASHTYTQPGTYLAIVTATDGEGAAASDSVTIVVTAPAQSVETVRINFQPASAVTPAGHTADSGRPFSTAIGFGWLQAVSTELRSATLDPRLDTYAYISNSKTATWQLALPAGDYSVTLAAGSPAFTGQHRVVVEGRVVIDNVATDAKQFVTVTDHAVSVRDGYLTLVIGGIPNNTKKTKLCYLEVRSVGSGASAGSQDGERDSAPPVLVEASPARGATGVAADAEIVVRLQDLSSGIDRTSLRLEVAGILVAPAVEGVADEVTLRWRPATPFAAGTSVGVRLRVTDLAAVPNTLDETWAFAVRAASTALGTRRSVDFQPRSRPTAIGSLVDNGRPFDETLGYGWLTPVDTDDGGSELDPRLETYAFVANPAAAVWQMALTPGDYALTLVVGSPTWTGLHRVEVEDEVVVPNIATADGEFHVVRDHVVHIADDFLTLRLGGIAGTRKKTKLCYVEIEPLAVSAARSRSTPRWWVEVDVAPASSEAPLEVVFDARASSRGPGVADDLSYTWSFGDGAVAEGARVTHRYSEPGSYVALLSLRNTAGEAHADTVRVQVQSPAATPRERSARRRINFQPREFETPESWTASSGEPFQLERGLGWDREVETGWARTNLGGVRNSYVSVDNRHPATFSVLVPNGRYRIWLTVGSPSHTAANRVVVEGQVAVGDVVTRPGGFVDIRGLEVQVRDGALSVQLGGSGRRSRTQICSLEFEAVDGESTEVAAAPGTAPTLRILRARSSTVPHVEITAPAASALRLEVYDVSGRRVRILWSGAMPGTRLRLDWDGRTDAGPTAPAGVYFVRAQIGRRSLAQKLLWMR